MPPKKAKKVAPGFYQKLAESHKPNKDTQVSTQADDADADASTDGEHAVNGADTHESADGETQNQPGKVDTDSEKKKKRRRKHDPTNFRLYIFKVLKQTHPDQGISKNAMQIMNDMVNDICIRICESAENLCKASKRNILAAHDIQSAVKLVLNGSLIGHALNEGSRSLQRFRSVTGRKVL